VIHDPRRPGTICAVSLRLLYLIFQHMLGLLLLMGRTSSTKDIGCSDWTRGRRYPPHQPETRLEWQTEP
jgi:hypothetical protein